MKTISPKEASELLNAGGTTMLDVRSPSEYAEDHIAGATNINVNSFMFEESVQKLDKNKSYVVYCQSGGRSARACSLLDSLGFKNAANLEGGISAWKREGLAVEK